MFLLVNLGLHINLSKPDLCLTQAFCFLVLCWNTVHMSVSLPSDKLADIQQLALYLLQTQPVAVCQVMSFLGKVNFCASGNSQMQRLCHAIRSDILTVYHSPTHLFSSVHFFFFSFTLAGTVVSFTTESSSFSIPLHDMVIATDVMPTHWAIYLRVLVFHY